MSKRVLLLLPEGFEAMEASCFTEVFGWADIYGETGFSIASAGARTPLRTTFSFSVNPEYLLEDLRLDEFDALAIPGGFEDAGYYEDALSNEFLEIVRHFDSRRAPIAGVCVGSLIMGAAGILKGKRATVYHQNGGQRKADLESYGAIFVDQPVVVDGHLITSTGPGTGIEVALELVSKLSTKDFSQNLRAHLRVPEPIASWWSGKQVP